MNRSLVLVLATALALGVTLGAGPDEQAPGGDFDRRMAEAIRLNDTGHYDAAMTLYRDLLKDYPRHPRVLYELAGSSLSAGQPKDAINYAEECLRQKSPYAGQCYLVMGSAYDAQGHLAKGAKAFRRGLRESAHESLLHFNLGVNLIQRDKTAAGISEILEGIKNDPGHASSWRVLGMAYQGMGQRGRAFVAYARFLTLESNTERSPAAAVQLWPLLFEGVTRVPKERGSTSAKITIPVPEEKADDPTTSQALIMSIVAASRDLDEWKDKSDAQFFANAFDNVLTFLDGLGANAKGRDPLWAATNGYFSGARQGGHLEAMAYEIRRSLGDLETLNWLRDHTEAVDRYRDWSKSWKPPDD